MLPRSSAGPGLWPPRPVLIVEPDFALRETICRMVRGLGYRVRAARSGADALRAVRQARVPAPDDTFRQSLRPCRGYIRKAEHLDQCPPLIPHRPRDGHDAEREGRERDVSRDIGGDRERPGGGVEQGISHPGRGEEPPAHADEPGQHKAEPERRHRMTGKRRGGEAAIEQCAAPGGL